MSWIASTSGPKPDLVSALGATYHSTNVANVGFEPDIIIECTGVGQVIADSIQKVGSGGIVCLTGVGRGGAAAGAAIADVAAAAVLKNNVDRWQRECQQAALVQGRRRIGPGGSEVAGAASLRAVKSRRISSRRSRENPMTSK